MVSAACTDNDVIPFRGVSGVRVFVSGIPEVATQTDDTRPADVPKTMVDRNTDGGTGFPKSAQCGPQSDAGIGRCCSFLKGLCVYRRGYRHGQENENSLFHDFLND